MAELTIEKDEAKVLAEKVLTELTKKIKADIGDAFYTEMEGYLFEHYENHKEKVENHLIEQITEKYVSEPGKYKFRSLREKIFNENKEVILASITDAVAEEAVTNVMLNHTSKRYYLDWRWQEAVADFINKHPERFVGNERFDQKMLRNIQRQKEQIEYLQNKVAEYEF